MKFSVVTMLVLSALSPLSNALVANDATQLVPHSLLSRDKHDVMCAPDQGKCGRNVEVTQEFCASACICTVRESDKKPVISCGTPQLDCWQSKVEEACKCLSKPGKGDCDGVELKHSKNKGEPKDKKEYKCGDGNKDEKGCVKDL